MWKDASKAELYSLTKWKISWPIVQTPKDIKPVGGHKWVFVQKQNENDEIVRYNAILDARGFSQRNNIDFEEKYSPIFDDTMFWYLIIWF